MSAPNTTPSSADGYIFRKQLQRVKDEITIAEFLAARGVEVRGGRARCPIHGGDNPQSLQVYPEERRFYCHPCHMHGDVLDLCELTDRHADNGTAMNALAREFAVELPSRDSKQLTRVDEKEKTRDVVRKHLARKYQRRLTKLYAHLFLTGDEAPEDELRDIEELAAALWPRCLVLAGRRLNGEA